MPRFASLLSPSFLLLSVACSSHSMDSGGGTFKAIPNPAILIANGGNGNISIIDPVSLTVVESLSVMSGMNPHHVGLSPDKTRVLITATSGDLSGGHGGGHGSSEASTMVYQLSLVSRDLNDIITVDATAHNAAFSRDGKAILLGMMEHGMVVGYDATTFSQTFEASGFEMPLEVTPASTNSLLVAESGAGRVTLFDLTSKSKTAMFDVGLTPVAAWASGDRNYFVSVEGGKLLKHLVEGAAVTLDTHAIDPNGIPGQAVMTPNAQELWVAVEDRGVVAYFNPDTHAKLGEFVAGTKPHGIIFEPSGARAFVTDEGGGRVLVVNVATHAVTSEIALGGKPNGIVWLAQ